MTAGPDRRHLCTRVRVRRLLPPTDETPMTHAYCWSSGCHGIRLWHYRRPTWHHNGRNVIEALHGHYNDENFRKSHPWRHNCCDIIEMSSYKSAAPRAWTTDVGHVCIECERQSCILFGVGSGRLGRESSDANGVWSNFLKKCAIPILSHDLSHNIPIFSRFSARIIA